MTKTAERMHTGRRYVVTGGASGIGRAISELLVREDAKVAIADRDVDAALDFASTLGRGCLAVELDVSSRPSWDTAVKAAHDAFGGIDGLVNNAGITRDRTMKRMSDDEWQQGAVETAMLADVPDEVKQGWISTIALGRLAAPGEIATAVAFLLSPASSYITAHVLDVNGGESHL